MLRASAIARYAAARCHYQVLGVSPTATMDEIKGAFRERAKATHPDIATSSDNSDRFREMVEAYKVLRDPRRRAEYDRHQYPGSRTSYQSSSGRSQWPTGEGAGMSEEARAKMYGYPPPGRDGPADAYYNPAGLKAESAVVGVVLVSGLWFMTGGRSMLQSPEELDPLPSRRPRSVDMGSNIVAKAGVDAAAAADGAGKTGKATDSVGDEMVRAYWNPFHKTWHRIPEGYEAPAAMDLTAWHKKRTDPVEWSRLFAEGKLSDILPRGGLKERWRPAWDTFEPVLVTDPHTGKTIQVTTKLPPRSGPPPACDVEF